jgi:anti-sigma regulatory factor (Ser/Thr protein kinase)
MAVRAYAVEDPSPVAVMRGVHQLVLQLSVPEMVTLVYLVFDPATRRLRFSNAGHPPPLVFGGGASRYLEDAVSPPLGVTADANFTEMSQDLWAGATVLLYTDGLIERRGESLQLGLDRLRHQAAGYQGSDVDTLCDDVLSALIRGDHVADDIALVAMHPLSDAGGRFELILPGEPRMLVEMRRALRQWLRDSAVATDDESEILVACGEACANVVRHAYSTTAVGNMELEAHITDGLLEVTVRDHGRWRSPTDRGGGWGLQLVHGLMDTVAVDRAAEGTVVRMHRRLHVSQDRG